MKKKQPWNLEQHKKFAKKLEGSRRVLQEGYIEASKAFPRNPIALSFHRALKYVDILRSKLDNEVCRITPDDSSVDPTTIYFGWK